MYHLIEVLIQLTFRIDYIGDFLVFKLLNTNFRFKDSKHSV